jgi:hypothetical protein
MNSMRSSTFRWLALGTLALLLVVFSGPRVLAQNPSLAELARKEEERRKAQKTPVKLLTNKDLPPAPAQPAVPQPARPAATPETPEPTAPEAKPEDERTEEWWRARMADAREKLRQNEMFAEALQSRVDALRRDFLNRDNPVQRARVGEDREKALAELNRVKGEIEKGKKEIADIEEEARKAGVPPGWLR